MQLNTYLNYGGNCEDAFKFYETHLGGRITMMMRHGEQPGGEADRIPGVLHARMTLGGAELTGADVPADRFQPMRSAYLTLTLESSAEAERVFALLSDGGEIFMPMQETFYATRARHASDARAARGRSRHVQRVFNCPQRALKQKEGPKARIF